MSGEPNPKPAKRVRLTPAQYREFAVELLAAHPRCACGCGRRADSLHHMIGGSGRSDVRENVVGLAGDGTRLCHGALTSAMRVWDNHGRVYIDPSQVRAGIRRHIEHERPEVLRHLVAVKGWDWVERMYPRRLA